MNRKLILIFCLVATAMLPSETWMSRNVLDPILWAEVVCFSLAFLADAIRGHNDPSEQPADENLNRSPKNV